MAKFQFRERIPIDVNHTLMQLLSRFQGVRDGLPELIKNSKDQYSRLGVFEPGLRVIVIAVNSEERCLAVVDFAGATRDQFNRWEIWSDPTANTRDKAADIEGGHGNGGKAFMVLGSTTDSSFESCREGLRTKMGYQNDDQKMRFKPGIALENNKPVESQPVASTRKQLDQSLSALGLNFKQLPKQAQVAFESRQAFTIARVNGVRDWSRARTDTVRRSIIELPQVIETHPQAAMTLESCAVWFVVDGQVIGDKPIHVEYPEPFPGFEVPLVFLVPDEIVDPRTGETTSTGPSDERKALTLRTSAKSLRTEDMRPIHAIRIRNDRNIVGAWSVADLCPGASSGFVFGEIRVPALSAEDLAGADRKSMNDTPLVRALESWVADQVKQLADKIQTATAKEHKSDDRDKVNQSLNKLRDLMRSFLSERDRGDAGAGLGAKGKGPGGRGPRPRPPKLNGERIDVIELEGGANSIAIPLGASIPLRVRAFEQSATGELLPVHSPELVAKSNPEGSLEIDAENQVAGKVGGKVDLWFENENTQIKSNVVCVELIECSDAGISGAPDRTLLQGEHLPIKVLYETSEGFRDDLLSEASVDEIGMGRISRNGNFTAGAQEGIATLRVRWGAKQTDTVSATLRIGPERVPPRSSKGGDQGGEIPLILLCGTPVPGMDHFPVDQRTIWPAEHMPTIIDYEPGFDNVIFINPDSRESIQARKGRGGRKPVAGIATETYYQFIALKCFEILKRLRVFEEARETPLTEVQFRERFAYAETECAPFIESAYEIAESIAQEGRSQ